MDRSRHMQAGQIRVRFEWIGRNSICEQFVTIALSPSLYLLDASHCPLLSLLKLDGSLLTSSHPSKATSSSSSSSSASASSSTNSSSEEVVPASIVGALVANIFKATELNGINYLQSQQLNMIQLECENGLIAVTRLARFLIVLQAKKATNSGVIRLKMNELVANLQSLQNVYAQ